MPVRPSILQSTTDDKSMMMMGHNNTKTEVDKDNTLQTVDSGYTSNFNFDQHETEMNPQYAPTTLATYGLPPPALSPYAFAQPYAAATTYMVPPPYYQAAPSPAAFWSTAATDAPQYFQAFPPPPHAINLQTGQQQRIGAVNFNATPSTQLDGSDLPLSDVATLRHFYNLGIDTYNRRLQAGCETPSTIGGGDNNIQDDFQKQQQQQHQEEQQQQQHQNQNQQHQDQRRDHENRPNRNESNYSRGGGGGNYGNRRGRRGQRGGGPGAASGNNSRGGRNQSSMNQGGKRNNYNSGKSGNDNSSMSDVQMTPSTPNHRQHQNQNQHGHGGRYGQQGGGSMSDETPKVGAEDRPLSTTVSVFQQSPGYQQQGMQQQQQDFQGGDGGQQGQQQQQPLLMTSIMQPTFYPCKYFFLKFKVTSFKKTFLSFN